MHLLVPPSLHCHVKATYISIVIFADGHGSSATGDICALVVSTGSYGYRLNPTLQRRISGTSLPFHDKQANGPGSGQSLLPNHRQHDREFRAPIPAEPHSIISVTRGVVEVYDTTHHKAPNAAKHASSRASIHDSISSPASQQTPLCPLSNKGLRNRSPRDSVLSVRRPHLFRRRIPTEVTMLSNGAAPHARNGSVSGGPPAEIPPYRHMSSGSLNIPNGLGQSNGNGQSQATAPMAPGARFEGPRSPPGKQSRPWIPSEELWNANQVL